MALNALQADMVRFTGTPGVEVNGIIVGYRAEYTPRTSTDPKYDRLIDNKHSSNIDYSGQYYVQLGEELYNGDLTKKHVTDDFERPSYNWQYKGKEIGTYVDYTVLVNGGTFTEDVKYSELYELLTYTSINDNDIVFYIDGVQQTISKSQFSRSNKTSLRGDTVTGAGQGVLTEVFLDRDRELITITCINTYLAQANSDYNTTNESLSLKVYQTGVSGSTKIVDSKEVPEAAGVAKDDYKLVYLSGKENNANYEVVRMFNPEIMSDSAVTKWSKVSATSPKVVDKLTTGGTEYKTNPKAFYDKGNVFDEYDQQLLTDMTYNIYMDRYGNVIGVDLYEGTKNYVFITGYDRSKSNISVKTADAAAIFMDGTMEQITVNVTNTDKNIDSIETSPDYDAYYNWIPAGERSHNRWYTYTTAANGNYTLKPVKNFFYSSYNNKADGSDTVAAANAAGNDITLNSANLYLDDGRVAPGYTAKSRIYGNDNSVYLTVKSGSVDTSYGIKDAIVDVKGVYTGAQNVKIDLLSKVKDKINTTEGEDAYVTGGAACLNNEKNAYIYSIFDSNYYIIASIVMGEAKGATTNYIYTLGGAKAEWVEKASSAKANDSDTYYWEFDAVVNGEETTLTVKSKFEDAIKPLKAFTVQEVRYDGEYVTEIETVDKDKIHTNNAVDTGEYGDIEKMDVYDVGRINGTAWASDEIGIMDNTDDNLDANGGANHRIDGTIQLVGRTLYTERATGDVGLALAADAKAVLIQPENGKREVTSCGSVAEAIGRLADEDKDVDGIQFQGRIVAVLGEGAVAKWVVIISDTNLVTGNNPDYSGTTGSDEFMINNTKVVVKVQGLNVKSVEATIDRTTGQVEIYVPKSLAKATDAEMAAELYESVTVRINNGVTMNAEYDRSTGSYYVFVVKGVYVNTEKDNVVVITVTAKGAEKPPVKPGEVTKVELDKTSLELKVKETATLKATVTAGEGADKTVTWTSSDSTVATVVGGKVTAVKAGTATITAKAGDKTATCTVEVTEGTVPPPAGDLPEGSVAAGTYTIPWYNSDSTVKHPTEQYVKDQVLAISTKAGAAVTVDKVYFNENTGAVTTAIDSTGTPLTGVTLVRYWKVTAGTAGSGYAKATDGSGAVIKGAEGSYLLSTNKKGADNTAIAVAANGNVGALGAMTGDVTLDAAAQIDLSDSSVSSSATITVDDETAAGRTTVANGDYVRIGDAIRVAKTSDNSNKYVQLAVNGKGVGTLVAGSADGNVFTYTVAEKDKDKDNSNKIKLTVSAGQKVTIDGTEVGVLPDGGASLNVTAVSLTKDTKLAVMPSGKNYLAKGGDETKYVTVTATAPTNPGDPWTYSIGDFTTKTGVTGTNGVISLVHVDLITVPLKAAATVKVGEDAVDNTSEANWLVAKGQTVTVTSATTGDNREGEKFQIGGKDAGTKGTKDTAATVSYSITGEKTAAVAISLLKQVKTVSLKAADSTAANAALTLEKASGSDATLGTITAASTPTIPATPASDTDSAEIGVTVAAGADYYFDGASLPEISEIAAAGSGKITFTVKEGTPAVDADGKLTFTVVVTVAA